MAIDLHTHTCYSDGTMTPEQLIRHAATIGLKVIAVTDHDVLDANPQAIRWGKKYGVKVIPGVEISINNSAVANSHMHLLGLFVDYHNGELKGKLSLLREGRENRNQKILAILNKLNMPLSVAELRAEAGEGAVGRPHIARLLFKRGYVGSIQEAFALYLKNGGIAYVDRFMLGEEEGIALIKQAKGLAILAHPVSLGIQTQEKREQKIKKLKKIGLDGIEVYYPRHSVNFTLWLKEIAQKYNLLISGGTDFHGENIKDIKLGTGFGNMKIPDQVYDNLLAHQKNKK